MRDLIDIVTEASFPPTDYGYWISQYAVVYPVKFHDHEAFIRTTEGCTSGEAIMDGWVRVVVGDAVFQAEACFPVLKPRVMAQMIALARAGDYTSFIVDNHDGRGDYTINDFATIPDLIRGIERLRQPEPVVEAGLDPALRSVADPGSQEP